MITLNIGSKGTGKTTRTKLYLSKLKTQQTIVMLDVNSEYSEFTNIHFAENMEEVFKALLILENTLFVIEEAVIFFGHHNEKTFYNWLVKQRHQNNDFIFNFHSLRQIPMYILDFVDYIILGKTHDLPSLVNAKFKNTKIELYYNDLQDKPKYDFKIFKP